MENSNNRPVNRPTPVNQPARRPARAPRASQTGMSAAPPWKWSTMSGRQPASSTLSWLNRQVSEDLNVARARNAEATGRMDVDLDERAATSARGLQWVRDRTSAALSAAGRGTSINPALTGARMVDLANDHAVDVDAVVLEAQRRRAALTQAVEDAKRARLEAQLNIMLDAADQASADTLVKGL